MSLKDFQGLDKIFLTAILVIFVLIAAALAHSEGAGELYEGFSIEFSPQTLIQNDEVALQAEIRDENGTAVSGLKVNFVIDKHDIGFTERLPSREREEAHYVSKYSFKNSGPHEVHVEFAFGGRDIRKTFDLNVLQTSPGEEIYFLAALLIAVAIVWIMEIRTHKHIRRAVVLSLLIAAAVGLSYGVFKTHASGAAAEGIIVCPTPGNCLWTAHVHAQLEFSICGEEIRLQVEKGPLDGPHTHEEKNLIHWHERTPIDQATGKLLDTTPLKLGSFFDAMEVAFSDTQIGDKEDGDTCPDGKPGVLKAFVNGIPIDNARDYIWKDKDVIKIVFDESPRPPPQNIGAAAIFRAPQISLPIIVGFALIDSINPCVIGVLILLVTILARSKRRRNIIINGGVYTGGVYFTYLIGGLTLLSVFNAVRGIVLVSQGLYAILGSFIIIAGFLEIKDFFWYGRVFSLAIPKRFVKHVESSAKNTHSSLLAAFFFGTIVTLIELPCTGAPYLAILSLMSQSGMAFLNSLTLLLLYNLIFVLPLIIIIYISYTGVGSKRMESWRKEHRGKMRLYIGLGLSGIGIWVIYSVAEYMLIPLIILILAVVGGMALFKYVLKKD